MTSDAEHLPPRLRRATQHVPVAELARRRGIQPIESVADMAMPDLFDSDQEYEEFLADLYAYRRADVA